MYIEVDSIDIEHYNIGILKGQFNVIHHVICNFHNTEENLQYTRREFYGNFYHT